VPVEPRLAFHEIAELAGHSHDHGSHDHDRPLPWWPLPAAAAAGVALLTPPLWSRSRRMGGVLTTKRVRLR
jgi:hypothetical protein